MRFRAPLFQTVRAARWPLLGFGGTALAFVIYSWSAEPPPPLPLVLPDRFVTVRLAPPVTPEVVQAPRPVEPVAPVAPLESVESVESVAPAGPRKPKEDLIGASPLLLKLVGTTGKRLGDELGLGDLDRALRQADGVALSGGATGSDLGNLVGVGAGAAGLPEASMASRGMDVTRPPHPLRTNPVVDTTTDWLSTFSIDVDTASWTQARKQLSSGYLPVPARVRAEEFVNYFPYDYAPPLDGQPFSVDIQGAPSVWTSGLHLVRIGVQGRRVSVFDRKPAHLTFLVDVSGSMGRDDKLPLVQASLHMLTDELRDGDTVALVTYAGNSEVVLQPTHALDRASIHRAIDQLASGGGTAMGDGVFTAYKLAAERLSRHAINRVIVASDGDMNIGPSDHSQITPTIQRYAKQGISLTTLGFGSGNYHDENMEQLANDGDGNYFYIDGEREARRVLVDKLTGTLEVIAKDVKIQVEWNPEAVESYRLVGYENRDIADRDFRNDRVDAGEVGAGHQVTALYELLLRDEVDAPLGAMRMRYKAPGPDSPASEISWPIARSSIRPSLAETDRSFRIGAAAAGLAEHLRASPHASAVSLASLEDLARAATRPEYPQDVELVSAIVRAQGLRPSEVSTWTTTPEAVVSVIRNHVGQLTYCYEKSLKADPNLAGQIEVSWEVDDGRVVSLPIVVANTTGDADLAACAIQKIRRWQFAEGVTGDFTWPFEFRAEG